MADPRIGPQPPPAAAPVRRVPDEARAAQRAFFQNALGRAQAPAEPQAARAPTRTEAPRPAPAAASVQAQIPAEPPARPLRPGSLLDIRV